MGSDFLRPKQSLNRYPTDVLIGDLLVKAGVIQQKQLDEAIRLAGSKHLHIGQMLIMAGYISNRELQAAVDAQSMMRDKSVDQNLAVRCLKTACKSGVPFAQAVREAESHDKAHQDSITNKLGELLLEAELIQYEQFHKAMQRSMATGLPLGRVLVLHNAIQEGVLNHALELQVRIRDDMLDRDAAVDAIRAAAGLEVTGHSPERALKVQSLLAPYRQKKIRIGELLVQGGVLQEQDVMSALELGLAMNLPIGQVMVDQGFIHPDMLDVALHLQELIELGQLDVAGAAEALTKIQTTGISFDQAVAEAGPAQPSERPLIPFDKLLSMSRIASQDEIHNALEAALKNEEVLAKILVMTGYVQEGVMEAALNAHAMMAQGALGQDDAIVALDYCVGKSADRALTFEEALLELGWTPPQASYLDGPAGEFDPASTVDSIPSLALAESLTQPQSNFDLLAHFGLNSGVRPANTPPAEVAAAQDQVVAAAEKATNGQEPEVATPAPKPVAAAAPVAAGAGAPGTMTGAQRAFAKVAASNSETRLPALEPTEALSAATPVVPVPVRAVSSQTSGQDSSGITVTTGGGGGLGSAGASNEATIAPEAAAEPVAEAAAEPATSAVATPPADETVAPGAKQKLSLSKGIAQDQDWSLSAVLAEIGPDGATPAQAGVAGAKNMGETIAPGSASAGMAAAAGQAAAAAAAPAAAPAAAAEPVAAAAAPAAAAPAAVPAATTAAPAATAAAAPEAQASSVLHSTRVDQNQTIPPGGLKLTAGELLKPEIETEHKPDPAEVSAALSGAMARLAESYYDQGEYAEAQKVYEKILAIKQAEHGPQHMDLVSDLNNLAGVLCVQGQFRQAEPFVRRVVTIMESTVPFDPLKLAEAITTLAGLYFQQGKYDQCEPLLARTLRLRQQQLGEDHPDVADNLRDYAKLLRKTGRQEEAEKYYAQAKAILAKQSK